MISWANDQGLGDLPVAQLESNTKKNDNLLRKYTNIYIYCEWQHTYHYIDLFHHKKE